MSNINDIITSGYCPEIRLRLLLLFQTHRDLCANWHPSSRLEALMLGCEMFPHAEAFPQETHTNKLHRPVSGLLGALCQLQCRWVTVTFFLSWILVSMKRVKHDFGFVFFKVACGSGNCRFSLGISYSWPATQFWLIIQVHFAFFLLFTSQCFVPSSCPSSCSSFESPVTRCLLPLIALSCVPLH